jgi:hypothetical protein
MSANTDNSRDQTPQEVAELWAQLHDEAVRRRDALKPAASRRWIAIIITSAAVVIALISVGAVRAIQQGQRVSAVTATAVAAAAAETLAMEQAGSAARETRAATTATADWNALETRQAGTATAQASATARTATVAAIATQTATAEAATAVAATKTAIACLQDDLYTAKVNEVQNLSPEPGATVVTGGIQGIPLISASWVITNTGECTWEQLALRRITGPSNYDVEIDTQIAPNKQTELRIQFRELPINPVNAEWYIEANGKALIDRGGKIVLAVPTWIIPQTATPTPTNTPTPTPTPTATPTPRVGNLVAKEPKSQRYMNEGVVFEWTYDTELESLFRFQILARAPNNTEHLLDVPGACQPFESQGNIYQCTVRDTGLLPTDGRHEWSVRVIDANGQVLRESATLHITTNCPELIP